MIFYSKNILKVTVLMGGIDMAMQNFNGYLIT